MSGLNSQYAITRLVCEPSGKIKKVLTDGLGLNLDRLPHMHFAGIVEAASQADAFEFFLRLADGKTHTQRLRLMLHSGSREVFAAARTELSQVLVCISSSLDNAVECLHESISHDDHSSDSKVYDEFTILNNQLVNAQRELAKSRAQAEREREFLLVTLRSIGDGVVVIDSQKRVTMLNEAAQNMLGLSAEEAIGLHIDEVLVMKSEDGSKTVENPIHEAFRIKKPVFLDEHVRLHRQDASPLYISDSAAPILDREHRLLGGVLVFQDATSMHTRQKQLQESEARFRLLAEHSRDMRYRIDLASSPNLAYANPALCDLIRKHLPAALEDHSKLWDLIHTRDRANVRRALRSGVVPEHPFVLRLVGSDGGIIYTEHMVVVETGDDGSPKAVYGSARDVTEQVLDRRKLEYRSTHDQLTGVGNRALFMRDLRSAFLNADFPICVAAIDVNDLKQINDTLGHSKGDELLRTCARILQRTFRRTDTVARLGGDEFAVLMPATSLESAQTSARRFEENIRAHSEAAERIALSAAIGVACADGPADSPEALMERADMSMYQDKSRKKAQDKHSQPEVP